MEVNVRIADKNDFDAIASTDADIFDNDVVPKLTREFLEDPRHHLALAFVEDEVIGMASAVHYIHPDKAPELFINEAGVDPKIQGKGVGRELIKKLCEHGKTLGCTSAWVATETDNLAAQKAYTAAGGKIDNKPFVLFEFDLEDID